MAAVTLADIHVLPRGMHMPGSLSPFRHVMATFFLPSLPRPGFRWFTMISCDFCWREASLWLRVVSTRRWLPFPSTIRFYVVLLFAIFFLLCYMGFCFSLWESTVFEFVLVTLFSAVLFLDFNSIVTVLTIFWWLLQVSSGGAVGLVLICFPFTFLTALSGPLKGPGHLFITFPTFCSYFYTVLVWFVSNVGKPTLFLLIGLTTFSSVRIRSGMDPLL